MAVTLYNLVQTPVRLFFTMFMILFAVVRVGTYFFDYHGVGIYRNYFSHIVLLALILVFYFVWMVMVLYGPLMIIVTLIAMPMLMAYSASSETSLQ